MTDKRKAPSPAAVHNDTSSLTDMPYEYAEMEHIERVDRANLAHSSTLYVRRTLPDSAFTIEKTEPGTGMKRGLSIDGGTISVWDGDRRSDAKMHQLHGTPGGSLPEALKKAVADVFADGTLMPREAIALEKLRQTLSAAIADDGQLSPKETVNILKRASELGA